MLTSKSGQFILKVAFLGIFFFWGVVGGGGGLLSGGRFFCVDQGKKKLMN